MGGRGESVSTTPVCHSLYKQQRENYFGNRALYGQKKDSYSKTAVGKRKGVGKLIMRRGENEVLETASNNWSPGHAIMIT